MPEKECWSCLSNSGERRISPGVPIHEGVHWVVEHAYPCTMKGWLVIVLLRHAESLHELTPEESRELGEIQARTVQLVAAEFDPVKVYVACFAEAPHFEHVHLHVVPRSPTQDPELLGTGVFATLRAPESEWVPREEVADLCTRLRAAWNPLSTR